MIKKRTRLTPQPAARKSVGKKTPKGRSDKKLGAKNSQNIVHPGPASELRGILRTPPEVEEMLAQELKDHPVTDREKQRLSDSLKLQYYFGGHWIAYRHTNQGKEVLAVGMEEIGRLMRKRMSAIERDAIVLGYCDPW
jgi:hypothetical protein